MFYGLDVHKRFVHVCALDPDGRRERSLRVPATREALEQFAGGLSAADAVVLETTFHSYEMARILARSGARVVVANSTEVKAIAHARIKTDKIDASKLAQLLRGDLIPEVHLPDLRTWERRKLITRRRLLIKHRTALKNAVRSQLNQKLLDPDGSSPFTSAGRAALGTLELGELDRFLLENTLASLDALQARIEAVEARLNRIAAEDESVRLLMTLPGVATTVAAGLAAAIGDVRRFATPGHLAAYLGLVPSTLSVRPALLPRRDHQARLELRPPS
jgi:transposase